MKRFLTLALIVLATLYALAGCGCSGEVIDYDLVFINYSDTAIVEVVADFTDRISGTRRADSCPMNRGESFGFEAGGYPVTLAVYERIFEENSAQKELASITINSAPPEGERWYITARDGVDGLVLAADTHQPEGV